MDNTLIAAGVMVLVFAVALTILNWTNRLPAFESDYDREERLRNPNRVSTIGAFAFIAWIVGGALVTAGLVTSPPASA